MNRRLLREYVRALLESDDEWGDDAPAEIPKRQRDRANALAQQRVGLKDIFMEDGDPLPPALERWFAVLTTHGILPPIPTSAKCDSLEYNGRTRVLTAYPHDGSMWSLRGVVPVNYNTGVWHMRATEEPNFVFDSAYALADKLRWQQDVEAYDEDQGQDVHEARLFETDDSSGWGEDAPHTLSEKERRMADVGGPLPTRKNVRVGRTLQRGNKTGWVRAAIDMVVDMFADGTIPPLRDADYYSIAPTRTEDGRIFVSVVGAVKDGEHYAQWQEHSGWKLYSELGDDDDADDEDIDDDPDWGPQHA